MAANSELETYPNYTINGKIARGYLCPLSKLFIGIDNGDTIRKAYVANPDLIDYLKRNCK